MGQTRDLLDGIGQLLAAAGIVDLIADGEIYTAGQTCYARYNLPDQPDRVVCATPYPVADSVMQARSSVRVQIRTRAGTDPDEESDLRDDVFEALQGRTNLDFGSIHIIQIKRMVTVPMGKDTADRWSFAQTYQFDINTAPSPYRNQ